MGNCFRSKPEIDRVYILIAVRTYPRYDHRSWDQHHIINQSIKGLELDKEGNPIISSLSWPYDGDIFYARIIPPEKALSYSHLGSVYID